MSVTAVLGAFWGDEGKGKIASYFADGAQICARFQGGPNAGHTVFYHGEKLTFRMIPAGGLRARHAIIGSGALIEPEMLLQELDWFCKLHRSDDSLKLSLNAHVILPHHRELDKSDDAGRIGTTQMGIGPCYAQKARRSGKRVRDLLNGDISGVAISKDTLAQFRERLGACCINTEQYVRQALSKGLKVVAEGAQGALLDIDHGEYPHVTSSNTTIGAVLTGLGVGPRDIERVILVASAYMTKVGGGAFPSRMDQHLEQILQDRGDELDGATGKLRQCGWLDVAALRWASEINQADGIILTKLDVLSGLDSLSIFRNGEKIREAAGWSEEIANVSEYAQLPIAAKNYVKLIGELAGVSVLGITNNRESDKILFVANEV